MSGNRAQFASNSEVPKSWEWLRSASGASPAEKEVEKANLTKQEKTHLANLMQRIANDEVLPKDVKFIKEHGLFEARLDGNHRIFRLLYVERGDGSRLVAALFTGKKARRLPSTSFETAKKRILDWDSRH